LAIVGRLDRGADLGSVLSALARRPRQQGYQALTGAETLYRTHVLLKEGDPAEQLGACRVAGGDGGETLVRPHGSQI
jgi:hypothetical protein